MSHPLLLAPIGRSLWRLAAPTTAVMIVQTFVAIAETYFFDKQVKFHLDYTTLARHLPELGAKRVVLTHMSPDMLVRVARGGCEVAEDGMVLTV